MEITKLLVFTCEDEPKLSKAVKANAIKMAGFMAGLAGGKGRPATQLFEAINSGAIGGPELMHFAMQGIMATMKSVSRMSLCDVLGAMASMASAEFSDQELELLKDAPDFIKESLPEELRERLRDFES